MVFFIFFCRDVIHHCGAAFMYLAKRRESDKECPAALLCWHLSVKEGRERPDADSGVYFCTSINHAQSLVALCHGPLDFPWIRACFILLPSFPSASITFTRFPPFYLSPFPPVTIQCHDCMSAFLKCFPIQEKKSVWVKMSALLRTVLCKMAKPGAICMGVCVCYF